MLHAGRAPVIAVVLQTVLFAGDRRDPPGPLKCYITLAEGNLWDDIPSKIPQLLYFFQIRSNFWVFFCFHIFDLLERGPFKCRWNASKVIIPQVVIFFAHDIFQCLETLGTKPVGFVDLSRRLWNLWTWWMRVRSHHQRWRHRPRKTSPSHWRWCHPEAMGVDPPCFCLFFLGPGMMDLGFWVFLIYSFFVGGNCFGHDECKSWKLKECLLVHGIWFLGWEFGDFSKLPIRFGSFFQ